MNAYDTPGYVTVNAGDQRGMTGALVEHVTERQRVDIGGIDCCHAGKKRPLLAIDLERKVKAIADKLGANGAVTYMIW